MRAATTVPVSMARTASFRNPKMHPAMPLLLSTDRKISSITLFGVPEESSASSCIWARSTPSALRHWPDSPGRNYPLPEEHGKRAPNRNPAGSHFPAETCQWPSTPCQLTGSSMARFKT